MLWYVRYGPGLVAPRPSDPPRRRRGWTLITSLSEAEALRIAKGRTIEGMSAEVGVIDRGTQRPRYSPAKLRDIASTSSAKIDRI
jgi:hypothetical protein